MLVYALEVVVLVLHGRLVPGVGVMDSFLDLVRSKVFKRQAVVLSFFHFGCAAASFRLLLGRALLLRYHVSLQNGPLFKVKERPHEVPVLRFTKSERASQDRDVNVVLASEILLIVLIFIRN